MSAGYQHWKLTLLGLVVAGVSLMMLAMGLRGIPGDDEGAVRMRLILSSVLGLVSGGGVFLYGVWRAADQDDDGTELDE